VQNQILLRVWKWIKEKAGALQKAEFYFSLKGPAGNDHYALFLSHLPEFETLIQKLPGNRFQEKSLILYFGLQSSLNEDKLKEFEIHFIPLSFGTRPLYLVPLTSKYPHNKKRIQRLTRGCRDWWCLTQGNALNPDDLISRLRKMGLVTGPSAFRTSHPDLKGEILINYFMDPSYHGESEEDFQILIEFLFEYAFQKLYPQQKGECLPLKFLHPIKNLRLKISDNPNESPSIQTQNFILTGGPKPTINKYRGPQNQGERMVWGEGRWSKLERIKISLQKRIFKLIFPYLIPILLIPIALIIFPITLILWGLMKGFRWINENWLQIKG